MLTAQSVLGTVAAVICLFGVIGVAVSGRRRSPAAVAVPAAGILVLSGVVSVTQAADELAFIGPTIGFLAAMFVVAAVCAQAGVFTWIGAMVAEASHGSAQRLLGMVFVAAAATTAVLSIDSTIVLLTPVAVATARRIGAKVMPVGAATAHLANSASTLLPVSNLTNLLALSATGLGFAGFAGLMAAPWVAAIAVEYVLFRWFFADDLRQPGHAIGGRRSASAPTVPPPPVPVLELTLLGLLLVGFVVAQPLGVPLAVVAALGAAVMLVKPAWQAPLPTAIRMGRALNVGFLAFVAALGIIVVPIRLGPVGDWVTTLIPAGDGFVTLLGVAVLAAAVANVVNNLPATLLLIPLVADRPGLALAMLLGVNIGPNLAYFGSLANLLWHDVMRRHTTSPPARRHLLLGALTVPPTLVASVVALWIGLQLS